MTIAIAWMRRIHDCEELVFASDSLLQGDGRTFDAAPKILTLPRGDCAIAFAGNTLDAFPMMLQLELAITSHAPSLRRSKEIAEVRTHALAVFNGMRKQVGRDPPIKGSPPTAEDPEFLFGGYSWVKKKFELWRIHYHTSDRMYIAEPAPWAYFSTAGKRVEIRTKSRPPRTDRIGQVAFAGDQSDLARRLLAEKLTKQHTSVPPFSKLDMQPFEVLRDILRDPDRSHTIGGAPQLAKIYQYMQAVPFAVYWPTKKSGRKYLQGRRCVGYERLDRKAVDPDRPDWKHFESEDNAPLD